MENGINFRIKKAYYYKEYVVCPARTSQQNPLELEDLLTSFIILLIGSIIAMVIFWIEKLVWNQSQYAVSGEPLEQL
jgi:hypothetical protein